MKLNIFKQNDLLEEQKKRNGTLKEIGFKKILNEVGIILENTISEDIEITELKQKELKKKQIRPTFATLTLQKISA